MEARTSPIASSRRLQLALDVLGDQVLDDDARLVQHDVAEADAIGEGDAALVHAGGAAPCRSGRGEGLQLARGDHLGEHHRGGLERLDLLFGVDPVGAVLDDEDAERVAGPQERHAEEGVVDLLARSRACRRRPDGSGRRKARAARPSRRSGPRGPRPERMVVRWTASRLRPSVAKSSSDAVAAHHIHGADLRHHVGGDEDHDLVETLLRATGSAMISRRRRRRTRGPPGALGMRLFVPRPGGRPASNGEPLDVTNYRLSAAIQTYRQSGAIKAV